MRGLLLIGLFIAAAVLLGANAREVPGGLGLVQLVPVEETTEAGPAAPTTGQVVAALAPGGGEETAELGDTVTVDYVTSTEDGTIYDTSIAEIGTVADIEKREFKPISFMLGGGQMIRGFERGILGMKKGESKTFEVLPELAYPYDDSKVRWMEKAEFREHGVEPEPGIQVFTDIGGEAGTAKLGTMRRMNDTHVEVDFNYELAGRKLVFDVILRDVQKR